jgi:hypothetical protein
LYQPIADLLGSLLDRPYRRPDRVSSNYFEGGYAAALIVLLAAVVESFVQRDRYFYVLTRAAAKPPSTIPEYMKNVLKYRRWAQLQEFLEVRNSVAHNHLWEVEFVTPLAGGRRHKGSSLVPGTHRLRSVPSSQARVPRTERTKLNFLPMRLDRTDVAKALGICLHALLFLSEKGHNRLSLADDTVKIRGKHVPFAQLEAEVRNAL